MTPIASLPMYDWPEVREPIDRLWAELRIALADLGIEAPPVLIRPAESLDHWRNPTLLLSQTCGLPLRRHLIDDVTVVGAFDHQLPGTPAGCYHSVMIVAADHPARSLADFDGATAAINHPDSQSGHAALRHAMIPTPTAIARSVRSGGHRTSIQLVGTGHADIAAIDAVSWELARRHEPAAAQCRVIHRTPATPGLPLVTALTNTATLPHLRGAVALAIAALDQVDRNALHIHALIAADADDYAILDEHWEAATNGGVPELI